MKNKTFFESIWCAVKGIIFGLKTEKNFKYYFVIALIFLALNIFLKASKMEFIVYGIMVAAVFSAEFTNTAIEHLVDNWTKEVCNEAKVIKDMAAGAVLCFGIVFFAVEGSILIPKL